MKSSKVTGALQSPDQSERSSQLPVLTDEVHPALPAEPVLRLAWDDSRLPVLTDVIEEDELSWKAVRALRAARRLR
jgi:hypothetical protein